MQATGSFRVICASLALLVTSAHAAFTATPESARAIAREAYLYGYPAVEMYKTLYAQAVEQGGPNYKAPINHIGNTANVFTPRDTAIITPNSDTPYSFVWMDLRAEPLVLTLPPVEKNRYYSVQLIDLYTQNFAYLGSRTTGTQGGTFMVAGPDWKGEKPANVDKLIRSESNLVYALYRTQLFDEQDLAQVKKIQAGYQVQGLSAFSGQPAPKPVPAVDWPRPQADMTATPALFRYLDFLLTFAPTHPSETALMQRFARIDVGPGLHFDERKLSVEQFKALQDGIADGQAEFTRFKKAQVDTRKVDSGALFGTREHLKNNYLYRYAGANMGIFGNSAEEASYIGYFVDSKGQPANAATHDYTLHFAKGALPPAKAFWSLTLYDGKSKLLVDNPLNRYLINSRMYDSLKKDADGGLTLYVQHRSPGQDKQSNWLPAPNGPLRIYMPGPELASGQWQLPLLTPTEKGGR